MFLWFLGGVWVCVWAVLQDPAVDYRLVLLGAVLPDLVDAPLGGARVAHTLVASIGLLFVVMLATTGRRRLRRRLLGLPIGTLFHLVLDGMWADTRVFWWPARGWWLAGAGALPSLAHPAAVTIAEELTGAALLVWCWFRFRLGEPERRAYFVRTGHVGRDLGPPVSRRRPR